MSAGLGCAYGMPSDYGVRDSGSKADVQIGDAANDVSSPDAGGDAAEGGVDASDSGG